MSNNNKNEINPEYLSIFNPIKKLASATRKLTNTALNHVDFPSNKFTAICKGIADITNEMIK